MTSALASDPIGIQFARAAESGVKTIAPMGALRSGVREPVGERRSAREILLLAVKPSAPRELHWHPLADESPYYIRRSARITVFLNGGKARTADFNAFHRTMLMTVYSTRMREPRCTGYL
jgi:hypothetical protein